MSRTKIKPESALPGPYEAIVVGHLDPKYMGTLQVEILKKSDSRNDPERSGQLVEAKYLSPFYGVTPQGGTSGNAGYQHSQKSYGMWMIPPDIGTKVLVILVEGNFSNAYWIGCVQDDYMNFMTPGNASTKQLEDYGKKAPAAEYNKRREAGTTKNPTKFAKPVHTDFAKNLIQQGLIDDDVRGVTSSSARREVPSAVFGISTPGPVDKRSGAPKFPSGVRDGKANVFVNRLGGTSFVMDDGDDKIIRKGHPKDTPPEYENVEALTEGATPTGDVTLPANELTRIRTRTGHQILLHNTEDLIYIGNARGTNWIEMTSNGKIDIYAQDSVSIHSSNDLNFTADRDVNFTAGENVNFMVGKDVRTTAGDAIHNTAGLDINNTAGQSISEIAGTHISNYANMDASYQSVGNTILASGKNLEITSGGNTNLESLFHTHIISGKSAALKVNGELNASVGDLTLNSGDIIASTGLVSMDVDRFIMHSASVINMEANNFVVNSKETTEINSDGDYYSLVDGNYRVKANSEIKLQSVKNKIRLRSETDIQLWAKAGSIEGLAANDVKIQAASGVLNLQSEGQTNLKSGAATHIEASQAINVKSGAVISVKGSQTQLQPTGSVAEAAAADLLPNDIVVNPFINYVKFYKYDSAGQAVIPSNNRPILPLPPVFAVQPTPAVYADRVARMPMHEPWYQHENLDPLQFTPDKTRAGSELPDAYNPQIPDTFATTPVTQSSLGTKSLSVTFDPNTLILGTGTEYTASNTQLVTWTEDAEMFNLTNELASAVYAVIVSQYGSWDYNRTETIPQTKGEPQEVAALLRKRYPALVTYTDNVLLDLVNAANIDENNFWQNVYGYYTDYGKALGNVNKNDAANFRGHGPYLGIVGRGIFEKMKTFVANNTAINLDQQANPFGLSEFDHRVLLAAYVYNHYKDHGRGTVGNVRIMLFGTEDYELMHKRDVEIYTKITLLETRTRDAN